ncbi:MAG: 30S ribosomal protein S16 [Planctomycetia bacterium]|nr:30S ribosomal protein S16 [Planctomycetia bacterium]
MKKIGRKHRPFFRICAVDSRSPRDGKVIEELGTYDPKVPDVDARVVMNQERLTYWLGVGAKPSEHVAVFIKKYGPKGIRLKEQEDARARLAMPKIVPPAPEAIIIPKKAEAAPAEEGSADAPAEASEAAG